ncbi:MAG: hypothetical protein HUU43_10270 [Ignavibacteriaceae bacterium]|nr:hypothetical protein [Ignavibacteriaceae bacterium]
MAKTAKKTASRPQKKEPAPQEQKVDLFFPYQIRWLNDKSKVKVWEKSRRIGATYVQAFEDVVDMAAGTYPAVWFTSADESAAKEYIFYCAQWAKMFDYAAAEVQENVLEDDKDIKVFTITFANGCRINALSSSPKAFRSKGGKVVIDEYAFHKDAAALWKAAKPATTWGFPIRILSTHNGKNCQYFRFVDQIKKGQLDWSLHTTDIYTAVSEGLADKISKRPLTDQERAEWLKAEEQDCGDSITWQEEYCCIPVDEATAYLPYELIHGVESAEFNMALDNRNLPAEGEFYLGWDIARKKDLSVIWIIQKVSLIYVTVSVVELHNVKYSVQQDILYDFLKQPSLRRACIDATGMGSPLAEFAQEKFGTYKVEAVTFSNKVKQDMAVKLRNVIEDKQILIPQTKEIREDLHSIRKVVTSAGNTRYDAERSESVTGHADRFWALALALHATEQGNQAWVRSAGRREFKTIVKGY